jgi:hypothetical protein
MLKIIDTWFLERRAILACSQDQSEFAHLAVGFGDKGFYPGRGWLQRLPDFLGQSGGKLTFLPGDGIYATSVKHPWQALAYATLGGISGKDEVPKAGRHLIDIARSSPVQADTEQEDLGHFLIGSALLLQDDEYYIPFGNDKIELRDLALICDKALDSSKSYCWGFHLCEGICLTARHCPHDQYLCERAKLRFEERMQFTQEILEKWSTGLFSDKPSNWLQLLSITAHALELFEIARYSKVISDDRNSLRVLLEKFAKEFLSTGILESFEMWRWVIGPLTHLRRAITFASMTNGSILPPPPVFIDAHAISFTSKYLCDLNSQFRPWFGHLDIHTPISLITAVKSIIKETNSPRISTRANYTSILPADWPPYLHYEVLNYGVEIGIELHLELAVSPNLSVAFARLSDELTSGESPAYCAEINEGYGKIFFRLPISCSADYLLERTNRFIEETFSIMNAEKLGSISYDSREI